MPQVTTQIEMNEKELMDLVQVEARRVLNGSHHGSVKIEFFGVADTIPDIPDTSRKIINLKARITFDGTVKK